MTSGWNSCFPLFPSAFPLPPSRFPLLTVPQSADHNTSMAVPRITKEDLKAKLDAADEAARPVLVDVRLKYPWEHSTLKLPGAVRYAPAGGPAPSLPKDRDLVLYDSDPNEITATSVAASLIPIGYRISVLKGGIGEWAGANFSTETKEAIRPAPAPEKPAAEKPAAAATSAAAAAPAATAKP